MSRLSAVIQKTYSTREVRELVNKKIKESVIILRQELRRKREKIKVLRSLV